MKVDFIDDIDTDDLSGKMVRLTSFNNEEITALIGKLKETLVSGGSFKISDFDFVTLVNCDIIFHFSEKNSVLYSLSEEKIVCELNSEGIESMINNLLPFLKYDSGFQFLLEPTNGIEFLISIHGGW